MHDALIIGGGLAGGAAACVLAREGRRVLLLEREAGAHHKLCGEFLSAEGAAALRHLGLAPESLGAQPIRRMRLATGHAVAEAALPFTAFGLSRRRLDAALLARGRTLGADVRQGVTVRALDEDGTAHLVDGSSIAARATLLATGKHELRGWKRPEGAPMVGFKLHLKLDGAQAARLTGHVELHLLPGGYAGLQMVEGGVANLCLLLREAPPGGLAALPERIAPAGSLLAERLRGSFPLWERPLAIARVPYGHLHDGEEDTPIWRLGDQAAVTPSFTGDGMAIALHSGLLAARMLIEGAGASAYHAALRGDAGTQLRRAMRLQMLLRLGRPAVALARLFPKLLTMGARHTRLPPSCERVFKPVRMG
jgi:flavin-dependent dehydrogenase